MSAVTAAVTGTCPGTDPDPDPGTVPVNTAPPAITGETAVGATLTVQPGTWTNGGLAAPAYQWQRCDVDGDDCEDVVDATATTFALTADDACSTFQVAETRTNASGSSSAMSAVTAAVTGTCPGTDPDPDPGTVPVNTAPPAITGETAVGATLTVQPGTWTNGGLARSRVSVAAV